MGREIRRVPANWRHPKRKYREDGYEPLRDDYIGALEYTIEELQDLKNYLVELKEKGKVKVYSKTFKDPNKVIDYCLEDFYLPDRKEFMPYGEWYQLYENVSEGTPISPPFEKVEELRSWLLNNKDYWGYTWTESSIDGILKHGSAPSGIMTGGKFYQAHEQGDIG